MKDIKLIAFDLDFTILDKDKKLSSENIRALEAARERGIEIVPATGRQYNNIPEGLKSMCRYLILINGAAVYDSLEDRYLYEAPLKTELALGILKHGDTLPCLYDCYTREEAFMNEDMLAVLDDYMPDPNYVKTMKSKRRPVPELKEHIINSGSPIYKLQYYFRRPEEREEQLKRLDEKFPGRLYVSTSLQTNIEINSAAGIKGKALEVLCSSLGFGLENAVAFGDGSNDLSMIQMAGTGVCLRNGAKVCLEAADIITRYDCNESGFGRELMSLMNYQENR